MTPRGGAGNFRSTMKTRAFALKPNAFPITTQNRITQPIP
jgi:hypothetical protein